MTTKYTERQRELMAWALTEALQYLSNGSVRDHRHTYICHALKQVGGAGAALAQQMIMERIWPYASVRFWLEKNVGEWPTRKDAQAYRKRWMKALIKEFRS